MRTCKQVRQVHLLNLGAKFPVPEDDWPALLALVDDLRADQPPLLPPDPQLVPWAERIVAHLKNRNEVGATFRSLKGQVGLRPIWHVKQDRIREHLFLAVLAYHGIHASWAGIRNRLASWIQVTTTMKTKAGELITLRQDRRADAGEELARAVGMEPQLRRQRRRTRPPKIPAR